MSEETGTVSAEANGSAPWSDIDLDLRTFLDFNPEPVLMVDASGRIVYANGAVRDLLGYPPDSLLGELVEKLVPEAYREGHVAQREAYVQTPTPRPMGAGRELTALAADGREVPVRISLGPIRTSSGLLVSVMLRDLTERLRAEAEAAEHLRDLERSNQELREFAHVASHDLQAPLRKIRSFGGRLVERAAGKLDAKSADYLERMVRAAVRMQTLIEDLLRYSRVTMKAGALGEVDLADVLEDALADLELEREECGADISIGPLPRVRADRAQLRHVFQNLLGNAMRFRRADTAPRVRVREETDGQARPGFCRVVVEDDGMGFAPRHAERIFQIFERLRPDDSREGSGVGLAICKSVVERHGGRIEAEGRPDQGATFRVELPLARGFP